MRVRLSVRHTLYRWLTRRAGRGTIGAAICGLVSEGIDPLAIPPCRRHVAFGCKFSFEMDDDLHDRLVAWVATNEMNATDVIRGILHRAWEADR